MQIKVNGELCEFGGSLSVLQLAEQLGLSLTQVAIEKNRAIVPRATYAQAAIMDGDEIEIVRFIGGG